MKSYPFLLITALCLIFFGCKRNDEKSIGDKVNAVSSILTQKYSQSVGAEIRKQGERKEIERRKKIKTKHVFNLTNANKPFTDFRFDQVFCIRL